MKDSPPHIQIVLESVIRLMGERRWIEAGIVYEKLTRQHREAVSAWITLARDLHHVGRNEEAESIYSYLRNHFPTDQRVLLEHAMLSYKRRQWPEAIKRFHLVRTEFPGVLDSYRFLGDLLIGEKRFEEADGILKEAMERFPTEPRLAISYAWSAQVKGDMSSDWHAAGERWKFVVKRFPDEPIGYAKLAHVLIRYLGGIDEAEAILSVGMKLFPQDIRIAREYARVADQRGDWSEALRRWEELSARWPEDPTIVLGRGETEARSRLFAISVLQQGQASSSVSVAKANSVDGKTPEGELFLKFESLGENCEFGLAQRHFGVEPLGLLRWVSMSPDSLSFALEEDFLGLDDPDDLQIKLVGPEYHMHGKRYQMRMHTHILASEYRGSAERLHAQMLRRLKFLKDKLLADLKIGAKIFVWQSGVGSELSTNSAFRMHRAVRRHGENTLLVVRRHNNPRVSPQIEESAPGLLSGALHQVEEMTGTDGKRKTMSPFNGWLDLCRQAVAQSSRSSG